MKKLVMYGLIIAALGILLQLLESFGLGLGISFTMAGLPMFPLLILVVLGAVVALYGFMKK